MAMFKNDVIRMKLALVKMGFLSKSCKTKLVDEWDNESKESYRAYQIANGVYPRQAENAPTSMNGLPTKLMAVLKEVEVELKKILASAATEVEAVKTNVEIEIKKGETLVETLVTGGQVSASASVPAVPSSSIDEDIKDLEEPTKKSVFSIF